MRGIRTLAILAALMSAALVVQFADKVRALLFWPLKLTAGSLSPVLALVGGATGLIGLLRRDWLSTAAGVSSLLISARYVKRVTTTHAGWEDAFGEDWADRIPPALKAAMLPRRYSALMKPPVASCQRQKDIVYGINPRTRRPLLADLWTPPADVPTSGLGVIYVHGGAWHIGDKDMGTSPLFRRLAAQGHVVMDIAYSLAPHVTLTEMATDVKRAIIWLKTNGSGYGVRPDRIVLVGGSAGGHLALLAAYTPNHPAFQPNGAQEDTSVRAVVSFYGPPDLRAAYQDIEVAKTALEADGRRLLSRRGLERMLRGAGMIPDEATVEEAGNLMVRLLGTSPEEDPEGYTLLSPIGHVSPACPPTLLLQGSVDVFGMAPAVQDLHESLVKAGVPAMLLEFPDTDHAFDLVFPWVSPAAQAATYDLERFIALMI